jgi:hypothetical protein
MTDPAPSGAADRTASASTIPDSKGQGCVGGCGCGCVCVGGIDAVSALGEHRSAQVRAALIKADHTERWSQDDHDETSAAVNQSVSQSVSHCYRCNIDEVIDCHNTAQLQGTM